MSKNLQVCVIGHPVSHSKSPLIHNEWIKHYRLEGKYEAIDIAPANLKQGVEDLVSRGYNGFNVTIPHKQAIVELCGEIDETAKEIGAVNTVNIKNGRLIGMNTDAFGFVESIKYKYKDYKFSKNKVVMLGAGGAARAVLYALIKERVGKVVILNRTLEKAEELAQSCIKPGIVSVVDWNKRHEVLGDTHMLVNTTSLGMQGQPPLDFPLQDLPKESLVVDLVYAPLYTDFICQAIRRKNPHVFGTGMLIHQARAAFQAWTGILPAVMPELEDMVAK